MNNIRVKKLITYSLYLTAIFMVIVFLVSCSKKDAAMQLQDSKAFQDKEILYYTCGMHPSVRVLPSEFAKGKVNCPICNMKLTPVYKELKAEALPQDRKILFYRHLQHSGITSVEPAKDEEGRDYIPVYEATGEKGLFYGCGMEGAEHVFLIEGIEGMNCPICGMPLVKLSEEEAERLKGVVSRVRIKGAQLRLAGVKTQPVKKLHLFKEIRTVGRVAYDPNLAVAEEELASSLNALDKIKEGGISEIEERAANLVESAKRKLRLLGLSEEQIKELEDTREIHKSLILPEDKMWIYGEVYEYELSWVQVGQKINVTTSSVPGKKFQGVISSVNPVLDSKTRSVTFRAQVDNPDLKLKPQMYVDVVIMSMYALPSGEDLVLAIPKDAILDTGTRRIVWVQKKVGEYEGRTVDIGPEATAAVDDKTSKYYPVLKGLAEGEIVVTKANFLIDSQSQITGIASSAYGGALGLEEEAAAKEAPGGPLHQH